MRISRHIEDSVILPVEAEGSDPPTVAWPLAASLICCLSLGLWVVLFRVLKLALLRF